MGSRLYLIERAQQIIDVAMGMGERVYDLKRRLRNTSSIGLDPDEQKLIAKLSSGPWVELDDWRTFSYYGTPAGKPLFTRIVMRRGLIIQLAAFVNGLVYLVFRMRGQAEDIVSNPYRDPSNVPAVAQLNDPHTAARRESLLTWSSSVYRSDIQPSFLR